MIEKVTKQAITDAISELSGETEITVEGEPYTITTRHTASGTPIAKATQFIHDRLQALGLTVSFHEWTSTDYAGRNVIGVLPGTADSPDIVLMVAHLDSINDTTDNPADPAPGADDDASGCAALLAVATAMKSESRLRHGQHQGRPGHGGPPGRPRHGDARVSRGRVHAPAPRGMTRGRARSGRDAGGRLSRGW